MSFVLFWYKNIQQIVYLINLHKITENTSFPTPAQNLGVNMSPLSPPAPLLHQMIFTKTSPGNNPLPRPGPGKDGAIKTFSVFLLLHRNWSDP